MCQAAFCPDHGATLYGVSYCRRHAGTVRAIGELAADPNGLPDLNDRTPSLVNWISRDLDEHIRTLLAGTARDGEQVVADDAVRLSRNSNRNLRWERSWRLVESTGLVLKMTVHVSEENDALVRINVEARWSPTGSRPGSRGDEWARRSMSPSTSRSGSSSTRTSRRASHRPSPSSARGAIGCTPGRQDAWWRFAPPSVRLCRGAGIIRHADGACSVGGGTVAKGRTWVARWASIALLVVTACLVTPARVGAAGPAPDASCSQESTARPQNDSAAAVVTFVNDTSETLQTFWISFSGQRVLYEQIPPGGSYSQGTWLTHPWIVADESGTCLTLEVVTATHATVTVGTPPVATLPPSTPEPTPVPAGGAAAPPPSHSGGATPTLPTRSTITSALPTPAQAFSNWRTTLLSAAIAVLAILLITFPAQLFNHTFNEHYDEIVAFWERRLPVVRRARAALLAGHDRARSRGVVVLVVVIGALLGGLLDPNFGFNGPSLTTYVSVILSTVWGISVSTLALIAYRRLRHRDAHWSLRALPAGLFIAAGCVLVSRITDFEPGYLYGVVCGTVFTGTLAKHEQGHAVAISTLVTVLLALLAWFAWVPVNAAAGGSGAAGPLVVLDDFLGAVFTGGLIGSTIGMIPLRFLPGGTLAAWHRGVWAAVTLVVTFAFVEIMLNPARGGHPGTAALGTVITLFVIFGGGSVAFAAYFARKKPLVVEGARAES